MTSLLGRLRGCTNRGLSFKHHSVGRDLWSDQTLTAVVVATDLREHLVHLMGGPTALSSGQKPYRHSTYSSLKCPPLSTLSTLHSILENDVDEAIWTRLGYDKVD